VGKSYQTIAFYQDKCDGCGDCVPACSRRHTDTINPGHSRIKVAKDTEQQSFGLPYAVNAGNLSA